MAPYRTPPPETRALIDRRNNDDRVLAGMLLIVGGIRVMYAIVARETFGTEASLALLMVVLAAVLLRRPRP